jgi:hypothetical protein
MKKRWNLESKCRKMYKNGRRNPSVFIYEVDIVFLPLAFEVYKEVSAK